MASAIPALRRRVKANGYPTGDGRPMSESDIHYRILTDSRETLDDYYADDPRVYVSGNILVFYEKGDRWRHLSPDVLVVKGIRKQERRNYLLWEEGKPPHWVLEITSASTRDEDLDDKFSLYQDKLKVREYFLFDPLAEYLDPPLRGYRLRRGKYVRIRQGNGRLPSQVLGLHLERRGRSLRFYNPVTSRYLPTPKQRATRAEAAQERAETAQERAETAQERAETAQERAEAENARLRAELDELRQRLTDSR